MALNESETDLRYQRVVDDLAAALLSLSLDELLARPDFGVVRRDVNGEEKQVGCWHHVFGDVHHIVFKTQRRVFWFFYRNYINGVVFGPGSTPRLMTGLEAGDYD